MSKGRRGDVTRGEFENDLVLPLRMNERMLAVGFNTE